MKSELTAGREGKNLMPSKADQRVYLKKIREAADGGDVLAMAALLGLARLDELLKNDKEIAMLSAEEAAARDLEMLGMEDNENGGKAEALAVILDAYPALRELLEPKK